MAHTGTPNLDPDRLGRYLRALGSRNRIELLRKLQVARTIGEIDLQPSRSEREGNPERALAWQTVEEHVKRLQTLGLVVARNAQRGGRTVREYVVNQGRLFVVVEELRALGQLQASDASQGQVTVPLLGAAPGGPALPAPAPGPALFATGGPLEGVRFPLSGAGPWSIGRSKEANLSLTYDLFCSGRNSEIRADGDRFLLRDLDSRNGTLHNWRRLGPAEEVALATGDAVRVGRSVLVFRSG